MLMLPVLVGGCAANLGGSRAELLLEQGLQLADARDYNQAAPLFRQAAKADSDAPTSVRWAAWNNLAVVLARTGQHRAALDAYQKALLHWPRSGLIRFNRGIAYLKLKRPGRAASDFRAAVTRKPKFAAAWNNLAVAQIRMKQYPLALTSMRRSLRHRTRSAAAWNNLGAAYLLLDRKLAARRAFKRALLLEPGHPAARRNLALLNKRAQRAPNQTSPLLVVASR